MTPVRTRASNFVYLGPGPDVGDAWVERVPSQHAVYLDWQPSKEERDLIADGALIRLGIHGMEPIPPVSLSVSEHQPLSEKGAAWRDRAQALLREIARGPTEIPAGYWTVSSDVWTALQADGALDPPNGVPTLWGRPLMELPDVEDDHMVFQASTTPPGEPALVQ